MGFGDAAVSVMRSNASPEAKQAVLDACDARVGCAAVDSLAERIQHRLTAALPRTDEYVAVLAASIRPGFTATA